jgi:hypothetical protein
MHCAPSVLHTTCCSIIVDVEVRVHRSRLGIPAECVWLNTGGKIGAIEILIYEKQQVTSYYSFYISDFTKR